MLNFKIDPADLSKLKGKLNAEKFQSALDIALMQIGFEMEKVAKEKAPYKTGNLRRSIHSEKTKSSIMTGTDLVYAPIHEFGGTIRPKKGKYLRFQINGHWMSTPSVTIPKRPYLMPAFEEQKAGRSLEILSKEINRILE